MIQLTIVGNNLVRAYEVPPTHQRLRDSPEKVDLFTGYIPNVGTTQGQTDPPRTQPEQIAKIAVILARLDAAQRVLVGDRQRELADHLALQ